MLSCCVLACSPQANRYAETGFKQELNPLFASVRQRVSRGCDGFHDDTTTSLHMCENSQYTREFYLFVK